MTKTALLALAILWLAPTVRAQAPLPTTTVPQTAAEQKRTAWFRDAHFGLFIHWGLYSVPAGEWKGKTDYGEWMMMSTRMPASEYAQFAPQFNPTHFDPNVWVRAAKNAGMRYVVLTTKHHEGFALWDSTANPFNVVRATPFKRDVVKELAAACRKAGLTFCVYYSDTDWRDPNFPAIYNPGHFHGDPSLAPDMDKYLSSMKAQMRELLTGYGPLGIFWFDNGGGFAGYDMGTVMHGQELVDLVHQLQPNCLVNNRAGVPGDYVTPEQEIPDTVLHAPWETCMTMNAHWGYNKNDREWKSPAVLVRDLIDITSKGGNFLLNIGPTADGELPPQSLYRLAQIGRWMRINGDAIHGAGPTPFPVTQSAWRCTTKPGKLYIHLLTWPGTSFTLNSLQGKVTRTYLLADPKRKPLPVTQTGGSVVIKLPARAPDPIASVLVLETNAVQANAVQTKPEETMDTWNEYTRHNFTVDGCAAWVVEPKQPLPGKPWAWCLEFPDAFTERIGAPTLLARGFSYAYIAVGNTFGSPAALKHFDAFYGAVRTQGLAPKAALIGISRGGLYAYRWAAQNPDKVSVIYGDAPVCDFKSWPAGKGSGTGSPADWAALLKCYRFKNEAESLAYPGNPVDILEPLAKARVALIHVVGDADNVVPVSENTAVVEKRYHALGGEMVVLHRPGVGHHPHGLDDPTPVVDFIVRHTLTPPTP